MKMKMTDSNKVLLLTMAAYTNFAQKPSIDQTMLSFREWICGEHIGWNLCAGDRI